MRDLLMIVIALITVRETSSMRGTSHQQWPQQQQQQQYWAPQGGNQVQFVNSCYNCPRYTLCASYYGRPYCYIPSPPQRCLHYPNPGTCNEQTYRYFYNMHSRQCQIFIYNGCGGNPNNFYNYQDCQSVCGYSGQAVNPSQVGSGADNSNPTNVASGSPNTVAGSTNDQVGASAKSQHGTVVNEQTAVVVKSQNDAGGHSGSSGQTDPGPSNLVDTTNIPSDCLLPMDKGNCRYNVYFRYHYDHSTNTCKRFQYSDCGGNSNRFFTLNSCRRTCVQPTP